MRSNLFSLEVVSCLTLSQALHRAVKVSKTLQLDQRRLFMSAIGTNGVTPEGRPHSDIVGPIHTRHKTWRKRTRSLNAITSK